MNDERTQQLLDQISGGDRKAFDDLLALHRARLRRMVNSRLHPKVRSRVDASDILQDAFVDASKRMEDYFESPSISFYLWLRFLTQQRIKMCHRRHLDVQKRSAKKDSLLFSNDSQALSEALAFELIGADSTPSEVAAKNEMNKQVEKLLDQMRPLDREILCLRHIEQMSNAEVAIALDLDPSTASSRYLRALSRLRSELGKLDGFLT